MNLVILQGNLTHDPELRYLDINDKKVAVCNFSLATHRYYTTKGERKKETTYLDCEIWDSGAETLYKYVQKGHLLLVRGALKNDTWENADGQKRSKIRVRVEDFELMPKKYIQNGASHETVETSVETSVDDTVEMDTTSDSDNKEQNGNDIPF